MNIIDTHQHLIDLNLFRYSWAEGLPTLVGRSFTVEDYLREIQGTGITGTVFMETSPDEWDLELGRILELVAQPGSIIRGIVANARP